MNERREFHATAVEQKAGHFKKKAERRLSSVRSGEEFILKQRKEKQNFNKTFDHFYAFHRPICEINLFYKYHTKMKI